MRLAWMLAWYRKSLLGKALLALPKSSFKFLMAHCCSDEAWYRTMFAWTQGYPLNLDHPQTLNEKIQWLKLYHRNPDFTDWADKYKVRDRIRDLLGETCLIPLLAVATDPRQIDFDALPEPFIIKSTHSSGQTLIVRSKSEMNRASVVRQCRHWLGTNLYRERREWQYQSIRPRIIVEQLLLDDSGTIPLDYKFHCFHGEIAAIQVDIDRQTKHRRNFYDVDWSPLPFTWSVCVGDKPLWPPGRNLEKPAVLPEMIAMTKRLAAAFAYVRIDWYALGNRIYFGEVTFHHGGGYERIQPFAWDGKLGGLLRLPSPLRRR